MMKLSNLQEILDTYHLATCARRTRGGDYKECTCRLIEALDEVAKLERKSALQERVIKRGIEYRAALEAELERSNKENAQLEAEIAALKRLIRDEFDFGEGEIRHYLKHAILTEQESEFVGGTTPTYFSAQNKEETVCSRCNGTGECDSGASDQQGNWIQIECECQREEPE